MTMVGSLYALSLVGAISEWDADWSCCPRGSATVAGLDPQMTALFIALLVLMATVFAWALRHRAAIATFAVAGALGVTMEHWFMWGPPVLFAAAIVLEMRAMEPPPHSVDARSRR